MQSIMVYVRSGARWCAEVTSQSMLERSFLGRFLQKHGEQILRSGKVEV